LGFLSNGAVVSKTASNFVGAVVGESQQNTSQIVESAKGKVLIIDEAYVLDDNLYGKQVLDTLVEKVQWGPSDDIAVLLLGYKEQMLQMIRKQNPGLARRFSKENAFYFDDYTENELLEIINLNLKANEMYADIEYRQKALEVLRGQKAQANFGNAGSVELIIKGSILKAAQRSAKDTNQLIKLLASDIADPGTERKTKLTDPLSVLDGLYRMEKVKQQLAKMRKTWTISKADGDEVPKVGHFVFTGSPGKWQSLLNSYLNRDQSSSNAFSLSPCRH
jgi:Cdc6-like AAA superfamily ATPase